MLRRECYKGLGQLKHTQTDQCLADKWYGKTQNGTYLSEFDAKAQGDHADHGSACQ